VYGLIIQQEEIVKAFKYVIIGVMGAFLIFAPEQGTAEKADPGSIQRVVIKIDSLSCGACFNTISTGLLSLKGYSGMGTNLFRKLIAIDFTLPLTVEDISRKLAEVGYPGTVVTIEPIPEKESFAYLESRRTGFKSGRGSCCTLSETSESTEKL